MNPAPVIFLNENVALEGKCLETPGVERDLIGVCALTDSAILAWQLM